MRFRETAAPTGPQAGQSIPLLIAIKNGQQIVDRLLRVAGTRLDMMGRMLVYVDVNPRCGLVEVACFLDVAMTTMSLAVDRLVKKALVEHRRAENNRRAVALIATDEGRQVVADTMAGYRNGRTVHRIALKPEERVLIRGLQRPAASFSTRNASIEMMLN